MEHCQEIVWHEIEFGEKSYKFSLCLNREVFQKYTQNVSEMPATNMDFIHEDSDATTYFFTEEDGPCAIVYFTTSEATQEQIAALIAHETVHIMHDFRRTFDIDDLDEEEEATAFGEVFYELICDYNEQAG